MEETTSYLSDEEKAFIEDVRRHPKLGARIADLVEIQLATIGAIKNICSLTERIELVRLAADHGIGTFTL